MAISENRVSGLNVAGQKAVCESQLQISQRHWTLALVGSAITTVVIAVLGLALGSVSLLHLIPPTNPLTTLGVVLLALTFPGLIFTAHCLDRIDGAMHAIKMADYEQKLIHITDADRMQ